MERKKEKSKLSCKRRESTDYFLDGSVSTSQLSASTPVRTNNLSEDEDSPYFPCSTQEVTEGIDVLWDWNSPQSKPKPSAIRKSKKRLNLQHSPKVPLRRHPSNNNEQIKQDFIKIQEELRALKAEIAKPDHEESLVLSPREEEVFKREENEMTLDSIHDFDNIIEEQPPDEDDFQDPFDDDMDEKLIFCSQQIEGTIENKSNLNIRQAENKIPTRLPKTTISNCDNRLTKTKSEYNNALSVMFQKKPEPKSLFQNSFSSKSKNEQVVTLQDSEVFNDSFDNVLSQLDDDDLDQLTQVVDIKQYKNSNNDSKVDKKSKVFPRSQSEDLIVTGAAQMTSRRVEWHRTQSFENYNAQLSTEKLQEIERKRLEAKAKRDAKKKQDVIVPTITEIPDAVKFSPDEIERKRLQALEKLEAKRLQDIIEKKKQEALKRREDNRKKKAANVKSSLTTRL